MQNYLEPLINFYPVSSDQTRVKALLEHAKAICEDAGLYVHMYEHKGIWNLFAAPKKTKHVKVLLQSHVDVVPAKDQPFEVADDRYYGRGTFDMLFATASYLKFVTDNKEKLQNLDFGIFLSGDEEVSGAHGVKHFLDEGHTADICILPDAGTRLGVLNIAAKGVYNIRIKISGQSHHGSRPWEGDGAAGKLIQFLAQAQQLFDHSDQENTTMTITNLSAGHADNQGPKEAEATLDIRYKDKADLRSTKDSLGELLTKYNGHVVKELHGDDYQLDMSDPHVTSFIAMYEQHIGKSIQTMKAPGSSDARFFSAHNIPVIMLRPEGNGAHGDNEWVSIIELEQFYMLLQKYVLETAWIPSRNAT